MKSAFAISPYVSVIRNFSISRPVSILLLTVTLFFHERATAQVSVSDWKFESQRKEIEPASYIDSKITYNGHPTITLAGGGKEHADGHWYTFINVEAGEYFQFETNFKTLNVEEPDRSILARILWQDGSGQMVGNAEYPAAQFDKIKDGWSLIKQTYKVPDGSKKAKIELHYRWDADGIVHFGGVSFQKTAAPKPRMVRLASVHLRPRDSKSTQENLLLFTEQIAKAAAQKADIICLPEGMTMVGTKHTYISASEPVPGPSTQYLGELAKKYGVYIVAGVVEKEGDVVYNTAVLMDRSGNLAGKYRKVSLPREEIDGGITPGNELPVFETDFGRIGMMICWDVFFPETARTLAQKGAEVIFLPIWGGNIHLAKARAIENQVYLVSSTYDMITAVFDQDGEVMKEATKDDPVIVVDVDLNKQHLLPWIGDFKNRIRREMPSKKALVTTAN